GKPEIAIDPADVRLFGISAEVGDQQLHRLAAGTLVPLAIRLEPVTVVVSRELTEECECILRKAAESIGGASDRHGSSFHPPRPQVKSAATKRRLSARP